MNEKIDLNAYWATYLASLGAGEPRPKRYLAWGFGDNPTLADELGELVMRGIKTATASLVWEYERGGEVMPAVGDHSIILDSKDEPLCIIETTNVFIRAFNQVDAQHAFMEGEGDRSLEFWRTAHRTYFARRCEVLGREAGDSMPVVCEWFRMVWR